MRTPEEDKRIAELLGSIPDIDSRLSLLNPDVKTTDWQAVDLGRDRDFGAQTHEILNGKVSVKFKIMEYQDFLCWYSDRNGFLSIGESMDNYLEFLEFSLETLPEMLFGPESDALEGAYIPGSEARIKYRTLKKDGTYSLGKEKDRLKLITELVTRPQLIQSLAVLGNRLDGQHQYNLIINFPQKNAPGSLMSIGVSSNDSANGAWSSDVARWVLGTHIDRDKLGDLDEVAMNLSDTIVQIKKSIVL